MRKPLNHRTLGLGLAAFAGISAFGAATELGAKARRLTPDTLGPAAVLASPGSTAVAQVPLTLPQALNAIAPVLGAFPSGSGGISYPELPELPDIPGLPGFERQAPAGSVSFAWPARGVFTSGYGWRWGRMHRGIDIAAPVGTPVVAAADGVVTYSRWNSGGYGYLVELTHADGTTTLYGHNSRLLVAEGQQVSQGQQLAQMGSTGRSTGPHLHFEIRPQGRQAVNPLQLLPPRA